MSVGLTVSSEQPAQKYTIESFLGSGATANVYKAVVQGSEPKEYIAVKIPHNRLSLTLQQRFWEEMETVQHLRKGPTTIQDLQEGPHPRLYFPETWAGTIDERQVLCIELVTGKPLTALMDYKEEMEKREQIALPVAFHYARMLAHMHRCKVSCPDRKPDDVYWDNDSGRMTVLDWNVVDRWEKFQGDAEKKKEAIRADITIFGRLWYEYLLGVLPPPPAERFERPLHGHPRWEHISLGMQRILEMALAPDAGYETADNLVEDLKAHNNNSQVADPTQIAGEALAKAKESAGKIRAGSSNQPALDLYGNIFDAMRLADLTRRKKKGDRLWKESAQLAEEWMQPAVQAKAALMNIQYGKALEFATKANTLVTTIPALGKYALAVERLKIVAEAGSSATSAASVITENKLLSPFIPQIVTLLDILGNEPLDVAKADSAWKALSQKFDSEEWPKNSPVRQKLEAFGQEVAFHQAWQDYRRSKKKDEKTAPNKLEEIIKSLKSQDKQEYALYQILFLKKVGTTLEELQEEFKQMSARANYQTKVNEARNVVVRHILEKKYWDAHQYFQKEWENLGGFPLTENERTMLLNLGKIALLLHRIEQAQERKDWDGLLTRPNGLLDSLRVQKNLVEIEPMISPAVRESYQAALTDLGGFYDNNKPDNPWHKMNDPNKALYAPWLYQLLKAWKDDDWFRRVVGKSVQSPSI